MIKLRNNMKKMVVSLSKKSGYEDFLFYLLNTFFEKIIENCYKRVSCVVPFIDFHWNHLLNSHLFEIKKIWYKLWLLDFILQHCELYPFSWIILLAYLFCSVRKNDNLDVGVEEVIFCGISNINIRLTNRYLFKQIFQILIMYSKRA